MATTPEANKDSVIILYKGGRLPSWYDLTPEDRNAHQQEHVDLMLSVAREHGLMRLEGFKLMTPQKSWERFWVIEFPTLLDAEAWIDAEMAPPYGRYGYYKYYTANHWEDGHFFSKWVTHSPEPVVPDGTDPHHIPTLDVDRGSVVVLLFEHWKSAVKHAIQPWEPGALEPGVRQIDLMRKMVIRATAMRRHREAEYLERMQSVVREHGLMQLETFDLRLERDGWYRAWLIEFPTFTGAEAWIDAEVGPPHVRHSVKTFYLARRWAPQYFAGWVQYAQHSET